MSTDRGSSGSGWVPTSSSSSSNSPFKLKFWSRPKDVALDAAMAEQTVRLAQPHLLHAHERIEYAFGMRSSGSHQSFFTSHRILVQYSKGMPGTTKRQRFTSLPFASISAWSLEITTSNNNSNNDSNNDSWKGDLDLKVWSSTGMTGGLLVVDLAATSGTELFALQHYMNGKCLLPHTLLRPNNSTLVTASRNESEEQPSIEISAAHNSNATHESQAQTTMPIMQSRMDLVHWLGKNNALAITDDTASLQFMRHVPVLASSSSPQQQEQEEQVALAWGAAGGRGCTLLTNVRILTVTLSSTGGLLLDRHQKLSFASWPWRSVGGWKSCTSGALLDTADTLWTLYTTVAEHPILALGVPLPLPDGLPGRDIESCLARALLAAAAAADGSAPRVVGPNDPPPLAAATATDTISSGPCSPKTNAWWFEESTNHKPLPATELNTHYHDVVPLLLPMETVELAFRGRYVFVYLLALTVLRRREIHP
jgi:hypothetical protein